MLPTDVDPRGAQEIGALLIRIGIIVMVVGGLVAAAIALTPTDPETATRGQNMVYALAFCLGPALLAGMLSMVVGWSMRRNKPPEDIGSLYRGDRRR
ncbi:MAG: hypothetical protein ACOX2L_09955 [Anaerolineae bacterium]